MGTETAAERLEDVAESAEERGGHAAKAAEPLREEATFVRSLEPAGPRAALGPVLPFALLVGAAFLADRFLGGAAHGPADRVRSGVARVGEELVERAWSLGRDARAEARKRQAWGLLQTATAAAFAVLSRRAAAGVWTAMTGERRPPRG